MEDTLPDLQDALLYLSLCVVDVQSPDYKISLNNSLKAPNSLYFDNILFLFVGNIPSSLVPELMDHDSEQKGQLPSNICYTRDNYPTVVAMIGAFLLRGQSKV